MIRHALVLSSMLTLSLAACRTDPDKVDTADLTEDCTWYEDADYDGYGDPDISAEGPCTGVGEGWADNDDDCDDRDAAINPDADEVCNAQDDDCDGEVDEDALDAVQLHVDADGDGFGDPENTVMACASEEGLVEDGTDCDDADPETFPGAPERCDGVDNDCDGEVDEELQEYWFADVDGDGFGDPDTTVESCDPGEGWVDNGDDCDDGDGAINPDAEEVCNELDDDCDGEVDEELLTTFWVDADNDGFGDPDQPADLCELVTGYADNDQDCDDNNSSISPDGTEVCNGLDDDCDGLIDDDDPEVTGTDSWYVDADGDGYGLDAYTTQACQQPSGYAALGGDCDDGDPAFNPGADEDDCADPNDYNCDGSTGYTDADADGWAACEDCNDADAAINPDATEQCNGVDDDCDGTVDEDDAVDAASWYADADGDGYGDAASVAAACDQPSGHVADDSDCDDSDAAVHPAAAESCNGVDDDCDGAVDEGVTSTFYADSDGDGFGDAASTIEACAASSGWVADDSDCDDSDAGVHPGADETCDGLDNDCDGSVDEAGAVDALTWYRDRDEDGYGDASTGTVACDQPSGYVADDLDCDDMNDAISPAADESCNGVDDDCDGTVDEDDAIDAATWFVDADGDSYGGAGLSVEACTQPSGFVADDSDCDDSDAAVNPAAAEICNEIDDDCDGYIDDQDPDVTGTSVWYVDYDGDGYGGLRLTRDACDQPPGYVADNTDCDDLDASANPGADEVCDGVDNDCDGAVDEPGALDEGTWYADADGDGFGDASISAVSCEPPSGFVADDTDCDDGAALVNPDAAEACNGVDDDCDGSTDEAGAVGESSWYADLDGDGYGDPAAGLASCDAPSGHVADSDDCDDTDAAINPGASEICNGVDDDCDGLTDDADGSVTGTATWYADADGDSYGDAGTSTVTCSGPSGYVLDASDCDDGDAAVNPGASEVCNGVDDDCDATVDEDDAVDASTWYADADGDSYGDPGTGTISCAAPAGTVSDGSDCDDTDAAINPGASEICNGVDDDCDGLTDDADGSVTGATTWYADYDSDGYGGSRFTRSACVQPSGYVATTGDCDDGDASAYPGAGEYCDGVDNDCDGSVDEAGALDESAWYADTDGDGYGDAASTQYACSQPSGYVSDSSDCDDGDGSVSPGAAELCNGADDDCDGTIDEDDAVDAATWYADVDGDGYGDPDAGTISCAQPAGTLADDSDCDDGDASINPAAAEVCDYVDNNCDGSDDEGYLVGSKYVLDSDCGSCGNDCSTYDYDNATASCDTAPSVPWCNFACDAGWYDADGETYNGCECLFISAIDDPFDGVDADCDGSDGDPSLAVFVSVDTGSTSGDGSPDAPLDSVQDGIDQAVADGKSYVLVAEGIYEESVALEEGLMVYGGWNSTFDEIDPSTYLSIIEATGFTSTSPAAVSAENITASTVFQGFWVYAWAGSADGSSAIGMWIEDCSDALVIADNVIEAGEGRAGADGLDGEDGDNGGNGINGEEGELSDCTALTTGGAGGSNSCGGTAVDGGDGGDAYCPTGSEVYQGSGYAGAPSGSGGGGGAAGCDGIIYYWNCGLCDISDCWDGGFDGGDGLDGGEGSSGAGASDPDGAVAAGFWFGETGTIGGDGEWGTGGGGGGAGSGAYVYSSCGDYHLGGTGGGGGAGGCAGLAGAGGGAGGASIGVLLRYTGVVSTLPVFSGNSISAAFGGHGGDGGNGGPGGVGGVGGFGGDAERTTAWCGLEGGDGGIGGDGGGGGGGGGGAGGPSYAAMAFGITPDAAYLSADNSMSYAYAGSAGRGGLGGNDPSSNGDNGVAGGEGEQNW